MNLKLTILIPCLNEVETIAFVLNKTISWVKDQVFNAEIIVCDNGSTDGSFDVVKQFDVNVLIIREKGYGNALLGGIKQARGQYIVIGDADGSHDFSQLEGFTEKLDKGYDLVLGCRYKRGGGKITKGSMSFVHRYIGNPFLTYLAKVLFGIQQNDIYCGFRGFTKKFARSIDFECHGMQFAPEMVIKAKLTGKNITEIPVTMWPSGRKNNVSHVNTVSDGFLTVIYFFKWRLKWNKFVF